MGAKELIALAIAMIIAIGGTLYVAGKGETKVLQQKIVQTNQTISTAREWASTYAGISVSKDYTGINMASLKAKGLFNYDVVGTGATSYIEMPFEDTIQLSIAPSTNNKEFILTVTLSSSNNFDATFKQIFEDKLNADIKTSATAITSYTATSADGKIAFQFAN